MAEPLEVIAARIARIALVNAPDVGRLGPGPVLSVVRDTTTGKIYVGLNTGLPKTMADVLHKSILAHKGRIWQGEVVVVQTGADAIGGHSEVNALNPAVLAREKVLGRKLTEKDLGVFELHNVWLRGQGTGTAAARCQHCAGITRGVAVTQSVFIAEGGVVGEVDVPQRGVVIPAGAGTARGVTTASGSVDVAERGAVTPAGGTASRSVTSTSGTIDVPQRGSVTTAGSTRGRPVTTTSGTIGGAGPAGGAMMGAMLGGLLTGAWVLSVPALKKWFAETYLAGKWSAEARAMVMKAIEAALPRVNILLLGHAQKIQSEKAAGHPVKLRIDVDTESVDTDMGPAQIHAEVSYFYVLYDGDTEVEWPVFQKPYGFWSRLLHAARITRRRSTLYFPL